MALTLAPAPVTSLHEDLARSLGVTLVSSLPQQRSRSLMVVEHADGCRSVVVVTHAVYGARAWLEVELDRIERSAVRHVELLDLWFAPADLVLSLPQGCTEHTSARWRAQHLPAQRLA